MFINFLPVPYRLAHDEKTLTGKCYGIECADCKTKVRGIKVLMKDYDTTQSLMSGSFITRDHGFIIFTKVI